MRIMVLPGDGIGREIAAAAVAVLEDLDRLLALDLELVEATIGFASLVREGTTLPARVYAGCCEADGIVLGPISHLEYPPEAEGGINVSARLRLGLDLYANVRPSRTHEGLREHTRAPMNLVIVRENTEGFYSDRNMHLGSGEFMPTPDVALSVRKVTAEASARVARVAFALAAERRHHVTAVHKANVLKISEGLFLREVRGVAAAHPESRYEEQLVDAMAALLVRDAGRFDVVVTTNMFGDILSDEAAELSGGLGLAGSINVGDRYCMAQAQHGSAPDLAGQDRANPCALVSSVGMLLGWLALHRNGGERYTYAAALLGRALDAVLADPGSRTADLGGPLGTRAFTGALRAELKRGADRLHGA